MRVLTFLHSFEPGGVERIALRLVRQWRALGFDAPLFMGRDDGVMRRDVGAGLDFVTPCEPCIHTARWETLWMICTLPGVVRRLRPDILFCAGNTYMIVAVALKLLLGDECPPILAKISNDLDRRDQPWWGRLFYRLWLRIQGQFVDHLVAMEEPMARQIWSALGVHADAITIIPDPALSHDLIDRLRARPYIARSAASGRRFVAVGRLAPQKNFALMLRAFARGGGKHDILTIIGVGPELPRLQRLARHLGIAGRVEFRGYLSEPAAILAEFDILLLSSNYEGVPAVLLEAMAARVAIVATNCSPSMAALLQCGALGKLVPVGDEGAMAGAIAGARADLQDDRLSLAQAHRFTLERAAEAYLEAMSLACRAAAAPFFDLTTEVPAPWRRQSGQIGDARS